MYTTLTNAKFIEATCDISQNGDKKYYNITLTQPGLKNAARVSTNEKVFKFCQENLKTFQPFKPVIDFGTGFYEKKPFLYITITEVEL